MTDYIPGPDMGTDEMCMAWVKDEVGRAVGLPRVMGGIPLDEIGATGFGLAVAADLAAPVVGLELDEARVVIQGFGAVGMHAARYLVDRGARIIAVADSRGALYDPAGLNMGALIAHKRTTGTVTTYAHGQRLPGAALIGIDCDIWIPAARADVLNDENVHQLSARMVLPEPTFRPRPRLKRGCTIMACSISLTSSPMPAASSARAWNTMAERNFRPSR